MRKEVIMLVILPFFILACSKKNVKSDQSQSQLDSAQKIEDVSAVTGQIEADIRNPEFVSHEGIQTVYFDFDKYEISPKMASVLSENAKTLKEKKWTILVEGHCDNRGTLEYNLALGQKRANVVKEYYMKLGIPESSIGTISYGEENPICKQDSEECWAKNRRAETKVSK
ncbi:MAG: peptidoglycan-associated lipoprotein Pal [Elusimicrobia bacterium]|nr:peptidoglycan-associated lipoprotein Pal [Elusimicrobiota bacterium]